MLYLIPAEQIDSVWSIVAPMIQKALKYGQGDYILRDVYNLLQDKVYQLWVWDTTGKIDACCVTRVIQYPRQRVLAVPYVGGTKLKDWAHIPDGDVLAGYAREQGCTQMEGFARQGWLRVLKNWRPVWTTIRRDL